jgi:hypothetical protein
VDWTACRDKDSSLVPKPFFSIFLHRHYTRSPDVCPAHHSTTAPLGGSGVDYPDTASRFVGGGVERRAVNDDGS